VVESSVKDHYKQITIPGHVVTALRELTGAQIDAIYKQHTKDRKQAEKERAQVLEQRRALMKAHYAGAVPIDVLKEEQDALTRRLAFLDVQIESHRETYENAKAHLEDLLYLAGGAHALYMSIPDEDRQICNMAFFDRIVATAEEQVEPDPHWAMQPDFPTGL
jgi:hypothetical protein